MLYFKYVTPLHAVTCISLLPSPDYMQLSESLQSGFEEVFGLLLSGPTKKKN